MNDDGTSYSEGTMRELGMERAAVGFATVQERPISMGLHVKEGYYFVLEGDDQCYLCSLKTIDARVAGGGIVPIGDFERDREGSDLTALRIAPVEPRAGVLIALIQQARLEAEGARRLAVAALERCEVSGGDESRPEHGGTEDPADDLGRPDPDLSATNGA